MKQLMTLVAAAVLALPLIGADYTSKGFCAKISRNGILKQVTYAGKEILRDSQIHGNYLLPPGEAKYDTRLFQALDGTGNAKIVTEGDRMTVTTESVLGNTKIAQAARYQATVTLSPDELVFRTVITLLTPLRGHSALFSRNFNIPASLVAGRGVRWVEENGKEFLRTVPREFQKDFRIRGREATFSLPGYLLTISAAENCSIGFWDSRQWKAPLLSFSMAAKERWSPEAVTFPAGKRWEWEFRIRMTQD